MICNRQLPVFLLFFIIFSVAITNSEHESLGVLDSLKSIFKSPIKWNTNKVAKETSNDLVALAEQKRRNDLQAEEPLLEGSIVPVEGNFKLPYSFLKAGPRQNNYLTCSCALNFRVVNYCLKDICTSLGISCGQTCTNSVIYTATSITFFNSNGNILSVTSTSFSYVNSCDCEKLGIICSASATVRAVMALFGAMAAIAVGVGVGVSAMLESSRPVTLTEAEVALATAISQETPENNIEVPVVGPDFPDDGFDE